MICPVMSTQVRKGYDTSTASYTNTIECQQDECAWWGNGHCVIWHIGHELAILARDSGLPIKID